MVTDSKRAEEIVDNISLYDADGRHDTTEDEKELRENIEAALAAVRKECNTELGKENAGFYSLGASVERENQEDMIAEFEAEIKEWSTAAGEVINTARCNYCDGSGLLGDYSMSPGTRPVCECCGGHEDAPGCGYDLTPEAVEKLNALNTLIEEEDG